MWLAESDKYAIVIMTCFPSKGWKMSEERFSLPSRVKLGRVLRSGVPVESVTILITAISSEYGGTAVTPEEFANGVVRPILKKLATSGFPELLATCGTTLLRDLVTDVRLREQAAEYLRRPE